MRQILGVILASASWQLPLRKYIPCNESFWGEYLQIQSILYIKTTESGKLITWGAIEAASILTWGRMCPWAGLSICLSACLSLTRFHVAQVDLELYVSMAGLELLVFPVSISQMLELYNIENMWSWRDSYRKVIDSSCGPKRQQAVGSMDRHGDANFSCIKGIIK